MGPEYIKYFSDKTIDVSITPLTACKLLYVVKKIPFGCKVVPQASDRFLSLLKGLDVCFLCFVCILSIKHGQPTAVCQLM